MSGICAQFCCYLRYWWWCSVYPGSWAACVSVWSTSTHQPTAVWEMTTWFMSTSKRRSALQSSSRSSPRISSFLPTSTFPHVSPPRLLRHSSPSSIVFILILCSDSPNLCIVPVIHTHVYVWFRAKVVPVWLRDNPLPGTLYTAIRRQSATLQYKHHFKEQTVTWALLN